MKITVLIERLALGAFVGCFIVSLIEVLIAFQSGPQNVVFSGYDVINAFFGSIVIGWAFSLSGLIYDKEDLSLPVAKTDWQVPSLPLAIVL